MADSEKPTKKKQEKGYQCKNFVTLVMIAVPILVVIFGAFTDQREVVPAVEAYQVRKTAKPAVDALSQTLFGTLMKAIKEDGPVHAADFCSEEAQDLTDEVDNEFEALSIKRTSNNYRNENNAPDTYEKAALEYFARMMKEQGKLPADYVQYVSDEEYRYYKPLKVGEGCLTCHGDPENIDEEILDILEERYPDDQATGYEEGDFRGVVRVSVPTSQIR